MIYKNYPEAYYKQQFIIKILKKKSRAKTNRFNIFARNYNNNSILSIAMSQFKQIKQTVRQIEKQIDRKIEIDRWVDKKRQIDILKNKREKD